MQSLPSVETCMNQISYFKQKQETNDVYKRVKGFVTIGNFMYFRLFSNTYFFSFRFDVFLGIQFQITYIPFYTFHVSAIKLFLQPDIFCFFFWHLGKLLYYQQVTNKFTLFMCINIYIVLNILYRIMGGGRVMMVHACCVGMCSEDGKLQSGQDFFINSSVRLELGVAYNGVKYRLALP